MHGRNLHLSLVINPDFHNGCDGEAVGGIPSPRPPSFLHPTSPPPSPLLAACGGNGSLPAAFRNCHTRARMLSHRRYDQARATRANTHRRGPRGASHGNECVAYGKMATERNHRCAHISRGTVPRGGWQANGRQSSPSLLSGASIRTVSEGEREGNTEAATRPWACLWRLPKPSCTSRPPSGRSRNECRLRGSRSP